MWGDEMWCVLPMPPKQLHGQWARGKGTTRDGPSSCRPTELHNGRHPMNLRRLFFGFGLALVRETTRESSAPYDGNAGQQGL